MAKLPLALVLLALAGCDDDDHMVAADMAVPDLARGPLDLSANPNEPCNGWPQWSQASGHGGAVCVTAQPPARVLQTVVIDPLSAIEIASADGDLLVHYQVPLIADDDVYVLHKSGSYSPDCGTPVPGMPEMPCYSWNSQVWNEVHYAWVGGRLTQTWSFESDWKPVPKGVAGSFQPTFQPALAGDVIYIPGLGGSVHKLDRHSGQELARLSPFATLDPDTYVSGPITTDPAGRAYYNVIKLDHAQPLTNDVDAWLVVIEPDGSVRSVDYAALVPNAPTSCQGDFNAFTPPPPRPWPPSDVIPGQPVLPPHLPCGHQRPGINVAPAIGRDGTIYTASRAHHGPRDSFVVAVNADLTPRWATSMADLVLDGCGISVPLNGSAAHPNNCRIDARRGVDPATNQTPAGIVTDASTATPVVLPDGAILYGTFSRYNGSRGHLVKLSATGKRLAAFDFGWDYTPGIWLHDGSYSIIVKDNHYTGPGPYFITQLDADLNIEWQFRSTNSKSCDGDPDGGVTCQDDHPEGFEWCINAPAVDNTGTILATGEDGVLYAIGQGGVDKGHLFMNLSLGAAYTPLALDHLGRIYAQNNGTMAVVGQ